MDNIYITNVMKKSILLLFLCFIYTTICFAQVRIVDKQGPYTNIRKSPNGTIIGRIPVNTKTKHVLLSGTTIDDWIGIQNVTTTNDLELWSNNGNLEDSGFIHKSLLRFIPEHPTTLYKNNIDKTGANTLTKEIGTIKRGEICKVLEAELGMFFWTHLKVQTPSGKIGWVFPYDDEGA